MTVPSVWIVDAFDVIGHVDKRELGVLVALFLMRYSEPLLPSSMLLTVRHNAFRTFKEFIKCQNRRIVRIGAK